MSSGTRTKKSRRILRIISAVLMLLALAMGLAVARFSSWMAEHERSLQARSKIATTARGDIEYAVVGTGTPSLSIHGSPGGFENALAARDADPKAYDEVMTITASRPGFLRTPLSSGKTFEEQADLFAALLDELHVDWAVVVASSGGGYIGLQFALRHPDRCIGLVLLSPSVNYEANAEGPPPAWLWRPMEFAMWAAGPRLGSLMMKDFDGNDPRHVALLNGVRPIPIGLRVPGALNDGLQRKDPAIDRWPLEKITVPTLLIHGDADENSIYQGSVYVASKVPRSTLITFEGGDHYIPITHMDEIRQHIRRFASALTANSDATGPEMGSER